MNRKLAGGLLAVGTLAAAFAYEWRYSDDMQQHITSINSDLQQARLESSYSTGLMGSLQTMTDETTVANEILETRDHVHTLKDEVLAQKVKSAAEGGVTVGGGIRSVLEKWPDMV